jgi:hypothetical protein
MLKMQVPRGAPVFISCDAGLADIQCDRLLLKGAYSVLGDVKDFPFDGLILAGCPLASAEIVAQLPQGGGRYAVRLYPRVLLDHQLLKIVSNHLWSDPTLSATRPSRPA